jgi:hypothetical protein
LQIERLQQFTEAGIGLHCVFLAVKSDLHRR